MRAELLLTHFDRVSKAEDLIPRLRRFVLDLAVRGKLVEQDAKDEPSIHLLARMQKEKERLIREGKVRNRDIGESAIGNTWPFPIPSSWAWCRLSEVGGIVGGGTPPSGDAEHFAPGGTGIAWLTPADLGGYSDLYISHGARDLTTKGFRSSSATMMPKGSVLFTSRAPIGYIAIAANDMSTNQGFKSVIPFFPESNVYIAAYFRAFGKWIDAKASGTTFREVSGKVVASLPFPLPPLAEQYRIVAKVDELMSLCDQLGAARAEQRTRLHRLAAASLHRLNNGGKAEDLRVDASFCLIHVSRLTTYPKQIGAWRQAILNLAVRGRLVPQDPKDEPAGILLARLRAETTAYCHEQDISPPKVDPIDNECIPYAAPKGWVWTRLSCLFKVITDGDHQPPPKSRDGIAFLTIGNVTKGVLDFSNCRFVPQSYLDSVATYRKPSHGDILYTVVGATYGRPALVDTERPFCVQRHIAILKPNSEVSTHFLLRMLASPLVYEQAVRSTTGAAQPTIPLRPLRNFLVLLPPLAEQRRIVAKVEQLMALCDQIDEQIAAAQSGASRLLEAVLRDALDDDGGGAGRTDDITAAPAVFSPAIAADIGDLAGGGGRR